jgi:HlyD family secretion protein
LDKKIEKKSPIKIKYILVSIGALVFFTLAWFILGAQKTNHNPVQNTVNEVIKAPFDFSISGRANIVPKKINLITAPSNGAVLDIPAISGGVVAQDQVLMVIDDSSASEELEKAKLEYSSSISKLKELEITLLFDLRNRQNDLSKAKNRRELVGMQFEAEKELYKDGIISKHQLKKTELEFSIAKQEASFALQGLSEYRDLYDSKIGSGKIQEKVAEQILRKKEIEFESLKIKSSSFGVIDKIDVKIGQVVTKGQQLMSISSQKLIAKIEVSESDASKVVLGQSVKLRGPNGFIDANVSSVSNSSIQGNVDVFADLKDPVPTWLRQNITLDATISVIKLDSASLVLAPAKGIYGDHQMTVINSEGVKRIETISFGSSANGMVQILSASIKPGEKIIFEN